MTLYKVSDLIDKLKPLDDFFKLFENDWEEYTKIFPDFMSDEFMGMYLPFYKELVEFEKSYQGCYITAVFDRDVAYQLPRH